MRPIESGDLNNVEYTIPDRIVENSNGDICIIDRTGGGNSRLLVLNKDGSLKFVYPNESEYDYIPNSPTKKISLSDVCCDTFSNKSPLSIGLIFSSIRTIFGLLLIVLKSTESH
jgi:hypothetical protein